MTDMKITANEQVRAAAMAIRQGLASDAQQQAFFSWLVTDAAGLNQSSFSPDVAVMAYKEGRRSIGLAVMDLSSPELNQTHDKEA
jgi:hypothetical protein